MGDARRFQRAARYLGKREALNTRELVAGGLEGVEQVVVIPLLAEEKTLLRTLESLGRNGEAERRRTLVLCVVNNRGEAHVDGRKIAENRRTLDLLDALVRGRTKDGAAGAVATSLRLGYVDASSPGRELGPKMGVGEARRIGLDCGLKVVLDNRLPRAPLLCLDGDTTVSKTYLAEVRRHFRGENTWAAVVSYEHPLPRDPVRWEAIVAYELFLRYHELGLRWAGSPYAFPTIGSTIVVRADAYVAAGGMNRRQAGEDFYFLQQLAKTGRVEKIRGTTVHPSSRRSDRVPFGTGASVGRQLDDTGATLEAYDPRCYEVLGSWLKTATENLESEAGDLLWRARDIHTLLADFLAAADFATAWPRLQANSPSSSDLTAQFHRWFDGFKVLKLIHCLRDGAFPQRGVYEAFTELADRLGLDWEEHRAEEGGIGPSRRLAMLELARRVT